MDGRPGRRLERPGIRLRLAGCILQDFGEVAVDGEDG